MISCSLSQRPSSITILYMIIVSLCDNVVFSELRTDILSIILNILSTNLFSLDKFYCMQRHQVCPWQTIFKQISQTTNYCNNFSMEFNESSLWKFFVWSNIFTLLSLLTALNYTEPTWLVWRYSITPPTPGLQCPPTLQSLLISTLKQGSSCLFQCDQSVLL